MIKPVLRDTAQGVDPASERRERGRARGSSANGDGGPPAGLISDLLRYGSDAARAEFDRAQLSLRHLARRMLRATILALAVLALGLTSAIFLMIGLSGALSDLWHGPAWSGNLAVAGLGLACLGVTIFVWRKHARRKTAAGAPAANGVASSPAITPAETERLLESDELRLQSHESILAACSAITGWWDGTVRRLDPRPWIARHVWLSVGSGFAAGVVASLKLGRPRAAREARAAERAAQAAAPNEPSRLAPQRSGWLATAGNILVATILPAFTRRGRSER